MNEKEYKIQKIKNGTVIDHIPHKKVWDVVKILDVDKLNELITLGSKLQGKNGLKDVLKIENRELTRNEYNKIAIVSPNAKVSIIENYKVKEKMVVELPIIIEEIVKCANEGCITNLERGIKTRFHVISKEPLQLKCHYCEKRFGKDKIELI
jgi:aspartate carbamoyltransferase regulatory subunit